MKNEKVIYFAFAVNHAGQFEAKHFGDADKYLIYHWDHTELVYINEMLNPFKAYDEEQAHGSQKKGMAIVEGLKKLEINVLVSKQFGKNIQIVNRYFVPVIAHKDLPGEIIPLLKTNMKLIEEELSHNRGEFKPIVLKTGF